MFSLVMLVFNLVLIAVVGTIFVVKYREAVGSKWQRTLAATQGSASLLWHYTVLFASDLLLWSEKAAEFFNLTEVQGVIAKLNPQLMAAALIVVTVVGIGARLRGLVRQWKEQSA